MSKKIYLLLIAIFLINTLVFSQEESSSIYDFYKNPSINSFNQCITNISSYLSNSNVNEEDKKSELMNGATFIAQVFNKYPQYVEPCLNKLSLMSFYEKALILKGLHIAQIQHPILNNITDQKLEEWVFFPPIKSISEINHLKINEPADLDRLWVSYFATGDNRFIRQIYEFIKSCNKSDLFYAYEFINREWIANTLSKLKGAHQDANLNDLYQSLKNESKSEAEYQKRLQHISTICAAMWLIDTNIKQDPEIKNLTQSLLKENPSLDWWPRIYNILGK